MWDLPTYFYSILYTALCVSNTVYSTIAFLVIFDQNPKLASNAIKNAWPLKHSTPWGNIMLTTDLRCI